ncbi:HIT domain-containing protein [Halieaceae bacterium IMCC14734]|uniref:HIT domain-containing protein n=1 Tax=Candidatus Litorirhabdus singularis TaxID=2518993 RepID=A0ABT3TCV6_9GAMM|nr:HIT domain-containing protein [Candidatus Litorirhabdus singularis]MCX2980126.1 HIT domain-containing protein [Candidatus Litorirhabdus singularis]
MIHPQLADDCHLLGRFDSCRVLLHRNAAVPWFILVPDTELEDVLDLSAIELGQVIRECQHLSTFLKSQLGFTKVNFAGLGNVVPQMHLHVIGRSTSDACWPQPVWGNLTQTAEYAADTLKQWVLMLQSDYGLQDC